LRGVGQYYLDCKCPIETALLELWISKISANYPDMPNRTDSGAGKKFKPGEFALNPVTLSIIGAAIHDASGLTTETMFAPKVQRIKTTIEWAIEELGSFDAFEEIPAEDKKVISAFTRVIGKIGANVE
jgi:hypothetical protein